MSDRTTLNQLERSLLNDYQQGISLSATPYADMADDLGVDENIVINTLQRLKDAGYISRVGPVFRPNRIGVSTLAAIAVPAAQVETIASIISAFDEVNHNYQREHVYNIWFVVTASDDEHLENVLQNIELACGYTLMSLPMQEDYFIDLGFRLPWE